jgi:hypothetical protein
MFVKDILPFYFLYIFFVEKVGISKKVKEWSFSFS